MARRAKNARIIRIDRTADNLIKNIVTDLNAHRKYGKDILSQGKDELDSEEVAIISKVLETITERLALIYDEINFKPE